MYPEKDRKGFVIRSLLIAFLMVCTMPLKAADNYPASAQATIEHVFNELFANLDELMETYDESQKAYFSRIDMAVSPWIDYETFSKGVMGRKYYTIASPQQRQRFQETFKNSLVETYGKSLLGVEEPDFEIELPDNYDASSPSAQIKQTLFSGTGRVVVIYSMAKADDGRWQLRNVILEGINLGKTFRSQFARSALEYNEDLDKVIENWSPEA